MEGNATALAVGECQSRVRSARSAEPITAATAVRPLNPGAVSPVSPDWFAFPVVGSFVVCAVLVDSVVEFSVVDCVVESLVVDCCVVVVGRWVVVGCSVVVGCWVVVGV